MASIDNDYIKTKIENILQLNSLRIMRIKKIENIYTNIKKQIYYR